jgi:hypothetical protein
MKPEIRVDPFQRQSACPKRPVPLSPSRLISSSIGSAPRQRRFPQRSTSRNRAPRNDGWLRTAWLNPKPHQGARTSVRMQGPALPTLTVVPKGTPASLATGTTQLRERGRYAFANPGNSRVYRLVPPPASSPPEIDGLPEPPPPRSTCGGGKPILEYGGLPPLSIRSPATLPIQQALAGSLSKPAAASPSWNTITEARTPQRASFPGPPQKAIWRSARKPPNFLTGARRPQTPRSPLLTAKVVVMY